MSVVDILLSRSEHADALQKRLDTAIEATEIAEIEALLHPAIESGIIYLEAVIANVG